MTEKMGFGVSLPWLKFYFQHLTFVKALKGYLNSLSFKFIGCKIMLAIMVLTL
jgi:hypothetical protein